MLEVGPADTESSVRRWGWFGLKLGTRGTLMHSWTGVHTDPPVDSPILETLLKWITYPLHRGRQRFDTLKLLDPGESRERSPELRCCPALPSYPSFLGLCLSPGSEASCPSGSRYLVVVITVLVVQRPLYPSLVPIEWVLQHGSRVSRFLAAFRSRLRLDGQDP